MSLKQIWGTSSRVFNNITRASRLATGLSIDTARRWGSTGGRRLKLNTGATMPALGFGTFQDADAQEEAVVKALRLGYRHIDTAKVYGTERQTGIAMKKSGVPRDEIFLVTKLWMNSHHPEDVHACLEGSLERLGTDYVDVLMMHYPVAFARGEALFPVEESTGYIATGTNPSYVDTWRAMEKLVSKGKVKALGVSNFNQKEIQDILDQCDTVPAVHQMELHPYLQQPDFVDWHKQKGIVNIQFSPLGNSNAFYAAQVWARPEAASMPPPMESPIVEEIAKKHNKTQAQVVYAWGLTNGRSVLSKSVIDWQITQNLEADFDLDTEDMAKISKMDCKARFNDPSPLYRYQLYEGLDGFKKMETTLQVPEELKQAQA